MLWLTDAQAAALVRHARDAAPEEACGLLAGVGSQVTDVIPITNAAEDPRQTYYMDERELATALLRLNARGQTLLAFYHSHPSGEPVPSPVDVQLATYPDTPYLIVGLRGEPRLAAWLLRYGQATPAPLHIGIRPPEPHDTPRRPMTRAQTAAILISALIAFALLIMISLSLLPPAPSVP